MKTCHVTDMEKWVEIRPVIMRGAPNACHVFLVVGHQSFCVTPQGCEEREEAEWMRDMLCIALKEIVDEGISDRPTARARAEG